MGQVARTKLASLEQHEVIYEVESRELAVGGNQAEEKE